LRPSLKRQPYYGLAQADIEQMKDADALRLVRGYDPTWEFVTMLLKSERRVSTYQVGLPEAGNSSAAS